ncbi:MAG: division/cell wall cluster transcriptional repressor MraZ [Acidobacteria bacterium]|nr:division/cell wall cluster transcriptional repressor MraZ [Acidobacteriota bacterium]
MLLGNFPARIDDKGRLKIPAQFKEELERSYRGDFFVSSPDGQYAWVYPMEEWAKIEEKLLASSVSGQLRRKFLDRANYYGQAVKWDPQGRILIPAQLRESAEIKGDVAVLGNLTHLTVRNNERYLAEIRENPITPEEMDALGIF